MRRHFPGLLSLQEKIRTSRQQESVNKYMKSGDKNGTENKRQVWKIYCKNRFAAVDLQHNYLNRNFSAHHSWGNRVFYGIRAGWASGDGCPVGLSGSHGTAGKLLSKKSSAFLCAGCGSCKPCGFSFYVPVG